MKIFVIFAYFRATQMCKFRKAAKEQLENQNLHTTRIQEVLHAYKKIMRINKVLQYFCFLSIMHCVQTRQFFGILFLKILFIYLFSFFEIF